MVPNFYHRILLTGALGMIVGGDSQARQMLAIAHRGASGSAPENTLQAFEWAVAYGARMVELDVHRCLTGELVVAHDDTVDRTTNGFGAIASMTLSQLQKLDAGNGQHIPTLAEVVKCVRGRARINVELKGLGTGKPVANLLNRYVSNKEFVSKNFRVSSFKHDELAKFREYNRTIELALSYVEPPPELELRNKIIQLSASGIDIDQHNLTEAFVRMVHQSHCTVYAYVVNDADVCARVSRYGVDGFFTDYPECFV
jgi:glycerophosphoryl diester phosphodiesterase